jgi:hypothetical protein
MLLNRAGENSEREREQLLALADNLFADGTIVLVGEVGSAAPMDANYPGDRYLESVDVLGSVGPDAGSILPEYAIVRKVDECELGALSTAALEDLIAAMEQYIGGAECVAEVRSSHGVIRLSSGELSGGGREQLRVNVRSSMVKNLEDRRARERFALGDELIRLPVMWSGSADQHKALDTWAAVQIDAQPISADTQRLHVDNMIMFARIYSSIPAPYVGALRTATNSGARTCACQPLDCWMSPLSPAAGREASNSTMVHCCAPTCCTI